VTCFHLNFVAADFCRRVHPPGNVPHLPPVSQVRAHHWSLELLPPVFGWELSSDRARSARPVISFRCSLRGSLVASSNRWLRELSAGAGFSSAAGFCVVRTQEHQIFFA
jgi:hypothetical protein